GFLCVDRTPFNLFQKPGWHGEGFFDRKSNYSISNQIIIFPHNLRIVDYSIGIPGSLHDSNAFQHTLCAWSPESFFGNNEWLWADSAYASQKWCVVPFKKPTGGSLKHLYGSLKGRFQSLRELRVQVQTPDDLQYVNTWVRCCLILHNMIVEIE
ncbi:hypothetical protein PAXINDRAFT_40692, partial [Paxillus involutus ATCC 200175]